MILIRALLEYVPAESTIVEIGRQYGCSTSAILAVARERSYRIYCIDPFTFEETGKQNDVGPAFLRTALSFKVPFSVLAMRSSEALAYVPKEIDMVHIDGDHSKEGVTIAASFIFVMMRHCSMISS